MSETPKKINVAVVSNIIFDPYFLQLMKKQFAPVEIGVHPIPYDERNESIYKTQLNSVDAIVVWLNIETLTSDLLKAEEDIVFICKRLHTDILKHSNTHILWFTFEDYYMNSHISHGRIFSDLINRLNFQVFDAIKGGENITFINLSHLIADVGIANTYDSRGKYRWNAPYSKALIEAAVKEIHKQYLIEKGITKKCLVLDCDNVLWGGILSEDGVENIKLGGGGFGRPYQDFQRFVLSLYYHGVILAVCSKNDVHDVLTMFREHNEMILKEEHIACFQVNWENKPDNIKRIAETLNISLDTMVFVDDSPIEIEAMKSMLPEVTAILYERDSVYDKLSCFNLKSNVSIADIEKRNETYRTNQSRETLKSQYQSYDEYIAALKMKMDIHVALPIEYSRIAELTQRTNKCTNGKRYTVAEIKSRVACRNVHLYSLSVSDRFSDLGLVGALEVERDTLTLFCLSCRALGREIEDKLLAFIADKHQLHKITFESTGKNENIKPIFTQEFPNATLTNRENS